ncbi:uncharacterized protein [Spinacia oleracea]|uniref:Uncharacterized protein n=1 Tax=Spinacia oleracea TaxID=3562 RepID=A0A9R0J743_SPIOL|nr:uncharacterized protein LOC110800236 [Spinacia oleracea]
MSKKTDIVAVLLILAVVQMMAGKAVTACSVTGDTCGFAGLACCAGYYCAVNDTCQEELRSNCRLVGESCGGFGGSCCGKSNCSGRIFGGHCLKP